MRSAVERLAEIFEQILGVLDTDRDPNQRLGDTHAGPAGWPHLMIDRVRYRNNQRARVTQITGRDRQLQTIQLIETIHTLFQLKAKQAAIRAEQGRR